MFGLCLDVGVFLLPFFLGQAQFLIIFVGQTPFLLMFVANPITPTSHIVFWCMISVLSHIYIIYIDIYVYYKYIYIHTHYTYIFIYIYTLYIHMFCMFKKRRCFFQWFLTPPRRHYHLQAPPGDGNQARPGGDVCHHGLLHWVWQFGLAFTRSKWD